MLLRLVLAALVVQALAVPPQAPEWDRGNLHSRGDVPCPCVGETGRFLDYCLIRERLFPMAPALPERWSETYTSVIVGRRDEPDGCGVFYFVLWIEGPVLRKVEVGSSVGSLWTSVFSTTMPRQTREGPLATPGTGDLKREIPVTAGVEKLQSLVKDLLEGEMNISPSGGLTLESPEYALHIIELGGELSVEDGSGDSSFARWIDRVRAQFPEASEACSPTAAAEPGAAPAEPAPR